jgi:hypothetical protein
MFDDARGGGQGGEGAKKVVRPRFRGPFWWPFVSLEHVRSLAACSGRVGVSEGSKMRGIEGAEHGLRGRLPKVNRLCMPSESGSRDPVDPPGRGGVHDPIWNRSKAISGSMVTW